jgi:hypothetical protein
MFGAMSSVNSTAHANDDNTTLNPILHLDNLDLSLSPHLSYRNKLARFWKCGSISSISAMMVLSLVPFGCDNLLSLLDGSDRARESLEFEGLVYFVALVVYLLDFLYGVLNLATCG